MTSITAAAGFERGAVQPVLRAAQIEGAGAGINCGVAGGAGAVAPGVAAAAASLTALVAWAKKRASGDEDIK